MQIQSVTFQTKSAADKKRVEALVSACMGQFNVQPDTPQPISPQQLTLFDDMKSADFLRDLPIDGLTIYCAKTGMPTGKRDEQLVQFMLRKMESTGEQIKDDTVGPTSALSQYFDLTSGCAPHWISTDSESLDWLQENDPVGYFSFCLTRGLEWLHQEIRNGNRHFTNPIRRVQFRRSQIAAYQLASKLPLDLLAKANRNFRQLFSCANPQQLNWPSIWPHAYCNEAALQYLAEQFAQVVASLAWKNRHNFVTASMRSLAQQLDSGLGNFKRQKGEKAADTHSQLIVNALQGFDFETARKSIRSLPEDKPNKAKYSGTVYTHQTVDINAIAAKLAAAASQPVAPTPTAPTAKQPARSLAELIAASKLAKAASENKE